MERRRTVLWSALVACAGAAAMAVMTRSPSARAQVVGPPRPPIGPRLALEPRLPARAVSDLRSATEQTAAVVEGVVTDVETEYSDEAGPWTRVTLSEVEAHFGTAPRKLEIRQFGGVLPGGRMMVAAELPVFVKDRRYVVFLRNTTWNVSSVVGDLAFRVERLGADEVLVDSEGHPVVAVKPEGFEKGPALFDGHELDGTPPKPLVADTSKLERKPLHRRGLLESLRSNLAVQQLAFKGTYNDKPAGEFKWRAQRVLPSPTDDGTRGQALQTEKDTSEDKQ